MLQLHMKAGFGQQMGADRCGDEEEERDQQLLDIRFTIDAPEVAHGGNQHAADAERGGFGRAM